MRSRENELDLIVYKHVIFLSFYSNRYSFIRLFVPNYLRFYFIEYLQQCVLYKFDHFLTWKNKFSN
jgi:hypothetical protein